MDYFNKEFIELCTSNRIEPMVTGDNQLHLICPVKPNKAIQEKILALIPKEQKVKFYESINSGTRTSILMLLTMYHAEEVAFQTGKNHDITVMVTVSSKETALQPDSPLWNKVAGLLENDPFVSIFSITVNGEEVMAGEKGIQLPMDDRFDYDREYLPADVGTDVRILLESSNTVEDFLSKI